MQMSIDQLKRWGRAVSVAALASSVLAVSACEEGSAGGEEGSDVEDVQQDENGGDGAGGDGAGGDGAAEVGSTVTVSAEITEVLSNQSFRLEGASDWGENPLLVVSAQENMNVSQGDVVSVTGTVREFDYATYSEDYELGDEGLYEEFDGEQFIVADDVSQNATPEAE
ncbi:hypothetical protein HNR06_002089 [Nocardiopsis arvandica]|uniref:DUF5666 domain-containing protein n=1 Tax=Nocardiopsis sinuspersici TaxID=501010 RepID=A0A7Z0BJV9_9ACTN|nr:hypothetical protein [Nocardiopsis sinuspersici]NYH52500.1 hypothetical protein [Nocardiopsis sinuspersici]